MSKATNAEKERRTDIIYTLLVNGASRFEICQYASKHWGLTNRQADRYIAGANSQIAAEAEYHRSRETGRSIARLNEVFKLCMAAKDYRSALAAQRELNALLSLYEPPAEQTLRILGLESAQLTAFVEAVKRLNWTPGEALNAYIEEIAKAESEADREP
jgi:hypothetical protein